MTTTLASGPLANPFSLARVTACNTPLSGEPLVYETTISPRLTCSSFDGETDAALVTGVVYDKFTGLTIGLAFVSTLSNSSSFSSPRSGEFQLSVSGLSVPKGQDGIQALVDGYLPISPIGFTASSGQVTLVDLPLVPEATPDGIFVQGFESGNYAPRR